MTEEAIYQKNYRAANAERLKAYSREYYLANRAQIIARSSARVKAHPQENYVSSKRWAQNHPEAVAAKFKRWYEKNKPANAARARKRRERERNVETTDATSSTVLAQLVSSCARMKCAICGKNMPKSDRTIDHVIPIAKGGTGHIANLQVVHLKCNCAKRCKMPDQLNGQHEINFGGNSPQLNKSEGKSKRQAFSRPIAGANQFNKKGTI